MELKAEYLIKEKDFSKLLSTLLKEKLVDKIIGAKVKVNKKSGEQDRFTVSPELWDDPKQSENFPLSNLIAYGYARTDSAGKYLHKSVEGANKERIGLIARPCDTRALIELAKIKQVNLDNLFIIALEDRGMVLKMSKEIKKIKDINPSKIVKEKIEDDKIVFLFKDGKKKELNIDVADNCTRCIRKTPVIADITISDVGLSIESEDLILKVYSENGNDLLEKSGIKFNKLDEKLKTKHESTLEKILKNSEEKRARDLKEWSELPQIEKLEKLKKCTMCGMCIRGCPVCYCVDCILQKKKKDKNIDNITYQLTRIAHDADRCIECGNCDNNCPMNLPLSLYFQSLNEVFKEKFKYSSGESIDDIPFRSACAIKEMELEK
ncbi:MAG: Coenzyme F420 hydrogenase/dehydrogenase, beta subunit C-terminal domain [Candidatus Lokiarchaeota archaeon]|nr:Coenzyme F420 hydrogenase/dehydrogenase, beta subunit C-terminal domain [Candidatus Lokiarchaeota archaeon]